MSTLSPDTSPEAEKVQLAIFRAMPTWRKAQLAADACDCARQLALAGLRLRHPSESQASLRRRLADLTLGEQLASRVYGPRV